MKCKRLLSLCLAAVMIFGSAAALPENTFTERTNISAAAEGTATVPIKIKEIRSGDYSYSELDDGTIEITNFWAKDTAVDLRIPQSIDNKSVSSISWGKPGPFYDCKKLATLVIPTGITNIGSLAFGYCQKLNSIYISGSVKTIGASAFQNCTELENLTLAEGVQEIRDLAFGGCTNLKSVFIPKSVETIGAFSLGYKDFSNKVDDFKIYCYKDTVGEKYAKDNGFAYEYINSDYDFIQLEDGTIKITKYIGKATATKVNIPSSIGGKKVTSIGGSAFEKCKALAKISIPKSLTYFEADAFEGTKWIVEQRKKNPLVIVNNTLIDGKTCSEKVTVPTGVKIVGDGAFYECKKITSVSLPNSVTIIGECSFALCENLTKVNIPKNVTEIGNYSFHGCRKLTGVTIPEGVKVIGANAFMGTDLKELTIPSSVNTIGFDAFWATNIKSLTILGNIEDFGQWAFAGCDKLTKITLSNKVTRIGMQAFVNCTGLKSITIPGSVKSFEGESFAYCTGLTDVKFEDGAICTGLLTFEGCSNLKNVTLPDSIKTIDDGSFSGCSNLKNINIPNGVTTIGIGAFSGCTSLKTITIPKSVTDIGKHAFGYYLDQKDDYKEKKVSGFKINCYKGTAGEKYAKDNGFNYTLIRNPEPKPTRLAGANRYETASVISTKMYPKTSDTVIIATGLTFHDAMVAVPLANAHNAPLLLATEKHITAQTEAELKRLKAKKVIVVSTNGAIGSGAKAELKALGLKATYIEGKNVFETSTKVAKALQTQNKKDPDTIFFATDGAFADALSASPVAAIKGAPIIYLNNKSIDKTVADYLKSVKGSVKNAYIIGGDGVISNAMMKNVAKALGLTSGKTVQRVAGANRYETCVAVNKKFKSVLNSDGICVAKGLDFPDALAGGVYAAATKQALFLADGKKLLDCQNTYLKGKNAGKITVFGGTGAVPDELVKLIAKASV